MGHLFVPAGTFVLDEIMFDEEMSDEIGDDDALDASSSKKQAKEADKSKANA